MKNVEKKQKNIMKITKTICDRKPAINIEKKRRKGYKEGVWKKLVQEFPRRRETKFKRISEKLSKFEKTILFLFFVCYKRWLR